MPDGQLRSWNDDRGFGFIEPLSGGPDVFVHISAFADRSRRPQVGDRLRFEVEIGDGGKPRARAARSAERGSSDGRPSATRRADGRSAATPRRRTASPRAAPVGATAMERAGAESLLVIPAFAILALLVTAVWPAPGWTLPLYGIASAASFVLYAVDKAAARAGGWRTQESTLHLLALAGGWPGALVAQVVLRHKSSKPTFRRRFWATVAANGALFVLLCSPAGRLLAQAVGEVAPLR